LEDFRKLQDELPNVRPTIFFSVPRLYEKVWEALEKNAFGRFYLKTNSKLLKRAMKGNLEERFLNAQASTGSAKSSGPITGDFIPREVYEQNKGNQGWMMKNYESIKKSMSRWK
jgi:long-subunit acyl-CoA synthetase (AMP-forming)